MDLYSASGRVTIQRCSQQEIHGKRNTFKEVEANEEQLVISYALSEG